MKKISALIVLVSLSAAPAALAKPRLNKPATDRVSRSASAPSSRAASTSATGRSDALFGGVHKGHMIEGTLGYPLLPHASYLYGFSDSFAIGATFNFSLNPYLFTGIFPGIELGAPMRFSISNGDFTAGYRLEPGLRFVFAGPIFGVTVNNDLNLGGRIGDKVILGGGLSVPFAFTFTPVVALWIPILVGPVLEIQPTDMISITLDAKFGPQIIVSSGSGVLFSARINAGVAFRL